MGTIHLPVWFVFLLATYLLVNIIQAIIKIVEYLT